jgi:hypothetical protein
MVNRINQQCYPNIFRELLDLDRTTLNDKCGWVPEKRNQGAYWSLLNVEVLNRLEPDESGDLAFWCGKHSFETMFRSVYMFRVSYHCMPPFVHLFCHRWPLLYSMGRLVLLLL